MINILFISHLASLTGAEHCLLDLLSNIDRAKFKPYVVVPHFDSSDAPLVDALKTLEIPTIRRHLVPWVAFSAQHKLKPWRIAFNTLLGIRKRVWAIAHLIQEHDIDVVYTNTVTPIEGALASKITATPHIWHLHEAIVGNPSLTPALPPRFCSWIVAKLAMRILVPSAFLVNAAYQTKLLKTKSMVIHNGVDPRVFKPDASARKYLEIQFSIPPDHKIVGIVGSLIPVKGHEDFFQAASIFAKKHKSVTFLVVGEGPPPYKNKLLSLVENLGIEQSVRFVGYSNDIAQLMPGLDLLVLTSKSESFSRTIVEAMASAVPVVSTDCGGPSELVIHGETGFLVPIGSIAALASAMETILLEPGLGKMMGKAGRKRVIQKFNIKFYVQQIESEILHAINKQT